MGLLYYIRNYQLWVALVMKTILLDWSLLSETAHFHAVPLSASSSLTKYGLSLPILNRHVLLSEDQIIG